MGAAGMLSFTQVWGGHRPAVLSKLGKGRKCRPLDGGPNETTSDSNRMHRATGNPAPCLVSLWEDRNTFWNQRVGLLDRRASFQGQDMSECPAWREALQGH